MALRFDLSPLHKCDRCGFRLTPATADAPTPFWCVLCLSYVKGTPITPTRLEES